MLLKSEALNRAYQDIFHELRTRKRGKRMAIDGKVSRGCYNTKGQSLLNMVSAWSTETSLCFGQRATKNEEGKEVGEYNTIDETDIEIQ